VTERADAAERPLGEGPAPMVERRPPAVPSRPLSYSAVAAFEECGYRFYMERILGLGAGAASPYSGESAPASAAAREERAAHGAAVHSLLEWSEANGWRQPSSELAGRHAVAAELEGNPGDHAESLLEPVRGWLASSMFEQRIAPNDARVSAEAPLLLRVAGAVLRGSIDLLVERDGDPPLVVDYKTDRLGEAEPAEHAARYEVQRDIYALAVAGAREADEIEVAYVFLERPNEPVSYRYGGAELEAGRERLAATISRIERGEFEPAPLERRDWGLCRGCPALGRMCSGPERSS
jgi:ATP-dependent helicase/nuclease subunit A